MAGLQSDDLDNQENELCLSTDAFMEQGLKFNKFVVVGHWPVTLYNKFRPSAESDHRHAKQDHFDRRRKTFLKMTVS